MTVIVPLDGVTLLQPGKLYSLDLIEGDGEYTGVVRPWRVTDVEAPITVDVPTVTNQVTLKEIPR